MPAGNTDGRSGCIMSMGNYLCPRGVSVSEMATTETSAFGVAHLTVVPANYDPDEETCQACGRPLSEHC